MEIKHPYLMFLGDAPDHLAAKVADGVAKWRPEWCIGQLRLPNCKADLGLDDMTLEESMAAGCKTLVVGVANRGGVISDNWRETIKKALELGLDIASGLHHRLADIPELAECAATNGRQMFDIRHPVEDFAVANGIKRRGKRVLGVGTDCSVGKMFTALALEKEMKKRNINCSFRATGQTGIFIAGNGVSVDAVVADFISGAAEILSPENTDPNHWDIIEGQGSLFHASYAGVSLGLLHGSQPDALIMCHVAKRDHMRGLPDYQLPNIIDCIKTTENLGQRTNPDCKVIGISVNSSILNDDEANSYLKKLEDETGLVAIDAFRHGATKLVDQLVKI